MFPTLQDGPLKKQEYSQYSAWKPNGSGAEHSVEGIVDNHLDMAWSTQAVE